jgi:protein gp37
MENSTIGWTDHTFNPWKICTPVSPGCVNCYAAAMAKRFGWGEYKKGVPRQRTSLAKWREPLKWNREKYLVCDHCGTAQRGAIARDQGCDNHECAAGHPVGSYHRARVFCASLADWLDEEAPIEWLRDLLQLIYKTPNLDWLLLTKRPENFLPRLEAIKTTDQDFAAWLLGWVFPEGEFHDGTRTPIAPANVWIGTTVEDQKRTERITDLLRIPARVRFLSVEPMLEVIDFGQVCTDPPNSGFAITDWLGRPDGEGENKIHWAIFGGESFGRECRVDWIRSGVRQCRAAGVNVFVKQLGTKVIDRNDVGIEEVDGTGWPTGTCFQEVESGYQGAPVRVRLKHPKGEDPSEWPEDLRIQEFPTPA